MSTSAMSTKVEDFALQLIFMLKHVVIILLNSKTKPYYMYLNFKDHCPSALNRGFILRLPKVHSAKLCPE